jgi:hypothetical protein
VIVDSAEFADPGSRAFFGGGKYASAVEVPGVAPGRYQILAAINAVHTSARCQGDTDWSQVLALYDQLVRLDPSPVVARSPSTVPSRSRSLEGPEVGLAAVDRLEDALAGYHACHATRADLLRRLDRVQHSRAAYDRAIALAGNVAEIASLTRRRDQLAQAASESGARAGVAQRALLVRFLPDASNLQIARVDDLVEAVGNEPCCRQAEKPTAQPSRL